MAKLSNWILKPLHWKGLQAIEYIIIYSFFRWRNMSKYIFMPQMLLIYINLYCTQNIALMCGIW